jgi:hypothetical protein
MPVAILLLGCSVAAFDTWVTVDDVNAVPAGTYTSQKSFEMCEDACLNANIFTWNTKSHHCFCSKDLSFGGVYSGHCISGCKKGVVANCSSAPTPSPASSKLPYWSAPKPDVKKPLAGYKPIPNAVNAAVYFGTLEGGWYNHAAMIQYHDGYFTLSWKNAPFSEDTPGQRILYAQSTDGLKWSNAAILFPNMSTTETPTAQFAGPFAVLNGRLYATATPAVIAAGDAQGAQWCLWPDGLDPRNCATPDRPGSQPTGLLIMRRVYSEGKLGPLFWASNTPAKVLAPAGRTNNVSSLSAMDKQTQDDVSLLSPTMPDMQAVCESGNGTLKCEGCDGGCHLYNSITKGLGIANERAHYTVPAAGANRGVSDVIVYRSHANALYASVRMDGKTQGNWSEIGLTDIPNDNSNLNAGVSACAHSASLQSPSSCSMLRLLLLSSYVVLFVRLPLVHVVYSQMLPDKKGVFIVSNGAPNKIRDPLTLATSADGFDFDRCRVVQTCTKLLKNSTCKARQKKNRNVGPSYPQAVSVVSPAPASVQGLYVVATNNKEDVIITKLLWADVLAEEQGSEEQEIPQNRATTNTAVDGPPCVGGCIQDATSGDPCHAQDGQQTCSHFFSFDGPSLDNCQYNSALQETICWEYWQRTGIARKCTDPAKDCLSVMLGKQCKLVPSGGGEWCIGLGAACVVNDTQAKACRKSAVAGALSAVPSLQYATATAAAGVPTASANVRSETFFHVRQTTFNATKTLICNNSDIVNTTILATSTCYKGGTAWFKMTCDSTGKTFTQRVWQGEHCTGNVAIIPGISCPAGNTTCSGCYPTSSNEEIAFTCVQ